LAAVSASSWLWARKARSSAWNARPAPVRARPAGFYERLGFVPTGDIDENGEVIMRLTLP